MTTCQQQPLFKDVVVCVLPFLALMSNERDVIVEFHLKNEPIK